MENYQDLILKAKELALLYVPKLLLAILTLIVGLWIIKLILKILNKALKKQDVDKTLLNFANGLISSILKIILFITVISMIGVKMTSFVAILGASALAIGMALQGSLANFAGGILIIMLKPFRIGDFIEANNYTGTVQSIQLFNTVLTTPDNKTIILPNSNVSNNTIINYTDVKQRRIEWNFGISYSEKFDKAKKVLQTIIDDDKRILTDPPPFIKVGELAASSVNIKVRVWCKPEEYWNIYFDMIEKVKTEFDKQKISFPFPQQDVHLYQN